MEAVKVDTEDELRLSLWLNPHAVGDTPAHAENGASI